MGKNTTSNTIHFKKKLFYLTIVDLQCCINFYCVIHTYIYIIFHILSHYSLSQDIECSSLYYTVGPCLSILYIIVCIANPKLPIHAFYLPKLSNHKSVLYICESVSVSQIKFICQHNTISIQQFTKHFLTDFDTCSPGFESSHLFFPNYPKATSVQFWIRSNRLIKHTERFGMELGTRGYPSLGLSHSLNGNFNSQ